MSCRHHLSLALVVALAACGPSSGGSSGSSATEPGATSTSTTTGESATTGESTTTDVQPTSTGDDPTTAPGSTTEAGTTTGDPGLCDVAQGDHTAACRAPDCAIAVDLEIRCADAGLAVPGMGVAPAPDATWFVTASWNEALLFRADADGAEQIVGVIDAYPGKNFQMTQGPDGAPHIVVDATTIPNYEDGLRHLALVDGAWTDTLVTDGDQYVPAFDVKVDSQGRPHVFFDGPKDANYAAAVLDGGTWTTHVIASPGPWTHFVLGPDDEEIALGAPDDQLQAIVDGQTVLLGSTLPMTVRYQAASAAVGPTLAAALRLGDELEVAWGPDGAAVAIAGTAAVGNACGPLGADGPDAACPGPCHDDAVGMFPGAFSFARTADGVGWLAWVMTHRDLDAHYELGRLDGGYFCLSQVDSDHSSGVLHLARVPLGAGAPAEVLVLPLADIAADGLPHSDGPRVSPVVLEAFGTDLALALRLRGEEGAYVRVLRMDTLELP